MPIAVFTIATETGIQTHSEREDREKYSETLRKLNMPMGMKKYTLLSFTELAKPDGVLDTFRAIGWEGGLEHLYTEARGNKKLRKSHHPGDT